MSRLLCTWASGVRSGTSIGGAFVVPARGLVREAAHRWFRRRGVTPMITAEPDGHEGLLALVALGYGTGIVPRLVLESSATASRLVEVPPPRCWSRSPSAYTCAAPICAAPWSPRYGGSPNPQPYTGLTDRLTANRIGHP